MSAPAAMSMTPLWVIPTTASPPAPPGTRSPTAGSAPSAEWARMYLKRRKIFNVKGGTLMCRPLHALTPILIFYVDTDITKHLLL